MGILRILSVIFSLIVVVIIGLSIFILTLDPNQYKEQIVTAVKDQTGRTLDIKGDISLAIFPTLRLEINDTTLSQPRNIQASKPFMRFDQALIGLELLPILDGNIVVTEVLLNAPYIYLISNGNNNNWSFDNPSKKVTAGTSKTQPQNNNPSSFSISKLQINKGNIEFEDRQVNQTHILKDVDLTLRDFASGKNAHLAIAGLYNPDNSALSASIDGDMEFTSDIEKMYFDANKSYFDVLLKGQDIPNNEMRVVYSGKMVLDAIKEQFTGAVSSLKVDQNTLNGDLKISSFAKPDITFNLNAEDLDLTPFMKPSTESAQQGKGSPKSVANPSISPLAGLRDIKLNGEINSKTVQLDNFKLTNFKTVLGGQRGAVTIEPMTFDFLGGKAQIGGLLNANEPQAAYNFEGVISSLKLGDLSSLLLKEASISGETESNFNLALRGNTPEQLMKTLTGVVDLNVTEGVISKWELSKRVNQVLALLQTGNLPQSGADTLDFTSLLFDADIKNGVFNVADLKLSSKALSAIGAGSINLANQTINYTITPTLGEGLVSKSSVREVPITISGPLTAPKYDIRIEDIARSKAKAKIDEVINNKLGRKLDSVLGEGGTESLKKLLPF